MEKNIKYMKTLKETLNEGWAGQEGIEAYNEIQPPILTVLFPE